ncbi:MAG: hypothetical protein SOX26_00135 [Phocaeicola sp.]|nr:hypothetical protein [Phocaeicola sp.]
MSYYRFYFIVFCLLLMTSCSNSNLVDEILDSGVQTRAIDMASYFQDIESTTFPNGEVYIKGYINCTEETEYSFTFAFQGNYGSSYEASIGTACKIYPTNGENFRELKVKLAPGKHLCDVHIYFSSCEQSAYARLVISSINGSLPAGDGYVDLVAQGISKIVCPGGSEPIHWTCPYCGFTLNSFGSNICISCEK